MGDPVQDTFSEWRRLSRAEQVRGLLRLADRIAASGVPDALIRRSDALSRAVLAGATGAALKHALMEGQALREAFDAAELADPGEPEPKGWGDAENDAQAFRNRERAVLWARGAMTIDLRIAAVALAAGKVTDLPPSLVKHAGEPDHYDLRELARLLIVG